MLNKDKAYSILEKAIKKSSRKCIEVYLFGGKNHLTRFAENMIHQNVIQKNYSLTVKVTEGKKVGISKCNIFDGENLEAVVKKAENLIQHIREDDLVVPPKGPESGSYFDTSAIYHDKTADVSPKERAEKVNEVISLCKPESIIGAGTVVTGDNMFAYMNSKKRFAYDKRTFSDFTVTLTNKTGGTSCESASLNNFYDMDFAEITRKALERVRLNTDPIEIEPGKYTVLLDELAVTTFLEFLAYMGFGGLQFLEKNSFMKIGEKITGENITITDNAYHKTVTGLPFDFEGSQRKAVTLLEKGVAMNVVHDHKTAAALKTETTGHALPPGSSMGPFPLNLEIKPGSKTTASIIKSVKKGILVSHLYYSNIVDRNKTTITGMTRDGTFLIEDGKITKPVLNMRYNENILEAFKRVTHLSKEQKTFMIDGGVESTVVPKLLIEDFHFTGVSKL